MKVDLSGQVAIVTGASRGIGQAIAKALHRSGATVAITGRFKKTVEAAAQEIGSNCIPFECDQREPSAIQSLADRVMNQFGAPDILVNNAGVMLGGDVQHFSLKNWEDVIFTNLTGVFLTTKSFLGAMIAKNKGDIIMIGSTSGKKGDGGAAAYAASKFGLQGFSQSLRHEVRRHNIRVTVINPSSVNKTKNGGFEFGEGVKLHANDIAETIVHLVALPGRTMIPEMEIWGTNPF